MATISAGTVTVSLVAVTQGFGKALSVAGNQLRGLQSQVASLASGFKLLTGAAAFGGLAVAVRQLADFDSGLGTLRGVLSGTIKDSQELEFNVQQLGQQARKTALETGFLATELVGAEVELTRAGLSAKATAANLKTIAQLARTEDLGVENAAKIAVNILRGLDLSAQEFQRVVDIIVSSANSSAASIQDLGVAFSYAAPLAKEFGQSAETTATAMGILSNAGIKQSRAGTTLVQILKVLIADFGKSDSVLKRFNISLFEGGEFTQTANSRFRQLTDILSDLRKKAGTASNFVGLFQSRALAGSLVLSRETAEELAKLAKALGDDVGSAARIAGLQLNTLGGQFARLKASLSELVLAFGFDGGFVSVLRSAVDQIIRVVTAIAGMDAKTRNLLVTVGTAVLKIAALGAGFTALISVVRLVTSPIGVLASALVGLTQGPDIISKYGPQLKQLGVLFMELADTAINSFDYLVSAGLAGALNKAKTLVLGFSESVRSYFGDDSPLPVFAALLNGLEYVAEGYRKDASAAGDLLSKNRALLAETTGLIFGVKGLGAALDDLNDSAQQIAQTGDPLSQILEGAMANLRQVQAEYDKAVRKVKTSNEIGNAINQALAIPGSEKIVEQLKQIDEQFTAVSNRVKAVKEFGTPDELSVKGFKVFTEALADINRQGLRPFEAETENIVDKLIELRNQAEQAGSANLGYFNDLIDQLRKVRVEIERVDLFSGFRSSFKDALQSVLDGSQQTIRLGEILKKGLVSAFVEGFDQIILEKFRFDKVFQRNIVDLGSFARNIFSKVFELGSSLFSGGTGGGFSQAISTGISALVGSIPFLGQGGIATSPQLAVVGDVPEAIVPLDRLDRFAGAASGGPPPIQIVTVEPPQSVRVQEAGGNSAKPLLQVLVGEAAKNMARGGALRQAVLGTTTARPRVGR